MEAHEALIRELDEATEQARRLVAETDARLFTVRPDAMRWSAAECLGHLSITTNEFLPILRSAIENGLNRNLRSAREPGMDTLGRVLRWFMEPPIRSKVKTTQPFVPRAIRAKAEALAEFEAAQRELVALVNAAKGLDVRKIKVRSAFDKRVSYNLYSAFRIIAAHERRHLWQAEQAVCALVGPCEPVKA